MRTLTIFLIIACGILATSCESAIAPISDALPSGGRESYPLLLDDAADGEITIIITWGSPDSVHTDSLRVIIPKGKGNEAYQPSKENVKKEGTTTVYTVNL